MIQALGVGEEEEKVGELIDEEEAEKAVVEDVRMEDRPSVAHESVGASRGFYIGRHGTATRPPSHKPNGP